MRKIILSLSMALILNGVQLIGACSYEDFFKDHFRDSSTLRIEHIILALTPRYDISQQIAERIRSFHTPAINSGFFFSPIQPIDTGMGDVTNMVNNFYTPIPNINFSRFIIPIGAVPLALPTLPGTYHETLPPES